MSEIEEKNKNETELEEQNEEKEKKKQKKKGKPQLSPESPPTEFIQFMLTAIGFYDYIFSRPFDLLFQDRAFMQYEVQIIEPLINYNESFKKVHEEYAVDELISSIMEAGKKRAAEGGYTNSLQKTSRKYTLPLYIGTIAAMGVVLVLSFMGLIPAGVEWYVMIPVLIVACLGPTLINYFMQKNWMKFIEDNLQDFISENINELKKGRDFVQEVINTAHGIMMEKEIDGRRFRMMVFNNDYENLNILEERAQKGIRFYVADFSTPPFEEMGDEANKAEKPKIDEGSEESEEFEKSDEWEIKEEG
ncbi:MAG: hypothetical protein EU547_05060 [Promethearchaeota archaeon]|nr:MAG: hypothetical protein EU547_05060 [Candidatus Lokiarchaeota archaeon]